MGARLFRDLARILASSVVLYNAFKGWGGRACSGGQAAERFPLRPRPERMTSKKNKKQTSELELSNTEN